MFVPATPVSLKPADLAIVSHVRKVEEMCGQLCNLSKPIRQGPFMGTVTSEVKSLYTYSIELT